MISDIDRICPVQFIEGRNKFAESAKASDISNSAYIEYVPKVSYSISRMDIFIAWSGESESRNNRLVIYADYLDHPTDIVLTEGNMAVKADEPDGQGWRTVEMEQPVVLIAHKRYWLRFTDIKTAFVFCVAEKGDEITVKTKSGDKWETKNGILMLRFYGRILPVALLH